MTTKTRYLLLLAGFLVFIAFAPIIVLYVRGVTFDFETGSFVQTGILTIKTEPKDVDIFLDDELIKRRNGSIRFLVPGEYQVKISKAGYRAWSKRLNILNGEVTVGNPFYNNIYLFYENPKEKIIQADVKDMLFARDKLAILKLGELIVVFADSEEIRNSQKHTLPKPVSKILSADLKAERWLLSNENGSTILLFDESQNKFFDLSKLVSRQTQIQFGQNSQIFAVSEGNLFSVDVSSLTQKQIFSGVKTFFVQENNLYYIQKLESKVSLLVSEAPFLQSQTLLTNLPDFSMGELFVSFEKQIYLLADGKLYRANSELDKLQDNIVLHNFDSKNSTLAILHSGQFDYISGGLNAQLNFVTRSSESLKNLVVNNSIAYGFYLKNGQLTAVEFDLRDNQNTYVLYTSASLEKFFVDAAGENIFILDNGELKKLTVR